MASKPRDYIDYWIENSVHASEEYRAPGASQEVNVLVQRLVENAKEQGISKKAMRREVGDLAEYIRGKLADANRVERDRHK